jgi:hypothetical protein
MLWTKGRPDIRLALRPARLSDGDALQSYVRGLFRPGERNRTNSPAPLPPRRHPRRMPESALG